MEEKNSVFKQKAKELIASIRSLSEMLPDSLICPIRFKLVSSAGDIPKYIENDNDNNSQKIKNLINISGALNECREYLQIVETLKYCSTKEIINKIDDFSDILATECPNITLMKDKNWEYKKAI